MNSLRMFQLQYQTDDRGFVYYHFHTFRDKTWHTSYLSFGLARRLADKLCSLHGIPDDVSRAGLYVGQLIVIPEGGAA